MFFLVIFSVPLSFHSMMLFLYEMFLFCWTGLCLVMKVKLTC